MARHPFYAVAEYRTASPEAADALAARLIAKGCDDLLPDHPGNAVQVSYGPFLSSEENLSALASDARFVLIRLAEGGVDSGARQFGVPTVLTATSVDSGTVFNLTDVSDPAVRSEASVRAADLLLAAIKKRKSSGWDESRSDLRVARATVMELDDGGLRDVRRDLMDLRDRNEDHCDWDTDTRREIDRINAELAMRDMYRDSAHIEQRRIETANYVARVKQAASAG